MNTSEGLSEDKGKTVRNDVNEREWTCEPASLKVRICVNYNFRKIW
jgi:hypothetical protein